MKLLVDQGNTYLKYQLLNAEDDVMKDGKFPSEGPFEFPSTEKGTALLASVATNTKRIKNLLIYAGWKVILLDATILLPFKSQYLTINTLGADRKALIAATISEFPAKASVVFSLGTCLTADLIDQNGLHLGGIISPGLNMRFKALHNFTGKLPLLNPEMETTWPPLSTNAAIRTGVQNGMLAEINAFLQQSRQLLGELNVILSGGDTHFFEKRIENVTFAAPNFIFKGLLLILNHNVEKS